MDRRSVAALAGVVLTLGLLAGCSDKSGSVSSTAGVGPAAPAVAGQGQGQPQPQPGIGKQDLAQQGTQPDQLAQAERKVVRTAAMELRSDNVADTVKRARDIGIRVGGYASQEDTRPDRGSVTLRVPTDKVDGVLDELGSAGETVARTQHVEDVTEQVVDVESRLASQRASVARVRVLLDRASSVTEVVSVEGELTKREADLESLQKRHDALSAQVAMSTVTVGVTRRAVPVPPTASTGGFVGGLSAGWRGLLVAADGVLTVLGAVLPTLVVLGVPAGVAFVIWRRWQARRATREQLLATAAREPSRE